MTELARRQRPSDQNRTLVFLSGILIVAGVLAVFAPELIRAFAPADVADVLIKNGLAMLLLGVGIKGYQVLQAVQQLRLRAKRAALTAPDQAWSVATGIATSAPAASQVDWTPLRRGGANFKTATLVVRGPNRIEIKASGPMILFCLAFIVIGLAVGGGMAVGMLSSMPSPAFALIPIAFGLVVAGIGFAVLYFITRRAVFDRQLGWFWKGSAGARTEREFRKFKQATPLHSIQALQLLAENVSSSESSYYSYELNLVLKDGTRLNVMDHGNRAALKADAEKLANFLGVPLWSSLSEGAVASR